MISDFLHAHLTNAKSGSERGEPRRFARHLLTLSATKFADGLIDPKLILAWLLTSLGAPGYLVGALVPVRESGALLPQIALARQIEARQIRKWFWVLGSALQGLAALGMAFAAIALEGASAGWVILGCLCVLSVARAACSASYKDIAERTLEKGTRGTVSGAAGTTAAIGTFVYAAALAAGIIPLTPTSIASAIALAGLLWIGAALIFAGLDEPKTDVDRDKSGLKSLLNPLKDDTFRTFIAVRALLISTALAPPFIVMMSSGIDGKSLGNLGYLLLATALATIFSSYVWGRLSDRSSRKTLMWAGALSALALAAAAIAGWRFETLAGLLAASFIFVAQLGYEGVRAGRKTHLTDMDAHGQKALYTALSNTMIGVFLVLGGSFGVVADIYGAQVTLIILAGMAAIGAALALSLPEVQADD